MNRITQARIAYLMARIRAGRGAQAVLIAEVVKAWNSRPARRHGDMRVQGWRLIAAPCLS